jgi:uncharacterized protein
LDNLFYILIVVGTVASFVGTLAGGGGLISLPAMMLFGVPIQLGIATNKFSTMVGAFSSIISLMKNKQLDGRSIFINVFVAMLGGITGALVTSSLSEKSMNLIALILLAFALVVTLKSKDWVSSSQKAVNKKGPFAKAIMPFFITVYDGVSVRARPHSQSSII